MAHEEVVEARAALTKATGGDEKMTEPLTKEQAAILTAYTGTMCCRNFSNAHEYIERKIGRPVMTHEMASSEVWKEIKEACRDDFMALIPTEATGGDDA